MSFGNPRSKIVSSVILPHGCGVHVQCSIQILHCSQYNNYADIALACHADVAPSVWPWYKNFQARSFGIKEAVSPFHSDIFIIQYACTFPHPHPLHVILSFLQLSHSQMAGSVLMPLSTCSMQRKSHCSRALALSGNTSHRYLASHSDNVPTANYNGKIQRSVVDL